LKVDPEQALRASNAKFRRRFAAMEQAAGGHEQLAVCGPEELEALWVQAKTSLSKVGTDRTEHESKR
jgi:XTP/dITP diphosphohydrolase/ATP diphosphatase